MPRKKEKSEKKQKPQRSFLRWIMAQKKWAIPGLLLILFIYLRFFDLERLLPYGWDQVDNAWAARDIVLYHHYPLLGMVAKQNSGFNIGPAYYYIVAPFYWMLNFYPTAAGYIAGFTAILTFFVLFYFTYKLFNFPVACIVVFIDTISSFITMGDRVQWPVDFIVPLSLVVFYCLYKVITGNIKYLFGLAAALGFSLHIHFTSVFYFIIVILSLPFFPWSKKTLKYMLLALPVLLIWLVPNIVVMIQAHNSQGSHMTSYLQTYYHGFHLRRLIQITNFGFVEFYTLFHKSVQNILNYFVFLLPPLFVVLYYYQQKSRERLLLGYLVLLWFLVPWVAFSTYKGEITNYYFFMTRPMVLFILAYFTYRLFIVRNIVPKIVVVGLWAWFAYVNLFDTFTYNRPDNILHAKERAIPAVQAGVKPDFFYLTTEAYMYWYYKDYKHGKIN